MQAAAAAFAQGYALGPRTPLACRRQAAAALRCLRHGSGPSGAACAIRYWEQEQTYATRAILQFYALALVWINGFMLWLGIGLGLG